MINVILRFNLKLNVIKSRRDMILTLKVELEFRLLKSRFVWIRRYCLKAFCVSKNEHYLKCLHDLAKERKSAILNRNLMMKQSSDKVNYISIQSLFYFILNCFTTLIDSISLYYICRHDHCSLFFKVERVEWIFFVFIIDDFLIVLRWCWRCLQTTSIKMYYITSTSQLNFN